MIKLNQSNLSSVSGIEVPTYDRSLIKTGILHIGLGNFHRAHQAVYLDQLLKADQNQEWGISSAIVRKEQADLHRSMLAQDGLYTLITLSSNNDAQARVIGSITELIDGVGDPQLLLDKIAEPSVKIILLTVTEGGYYFSEKENRLLTEHPDLQADLNGKFRTVYAYLKAGLELRMKNSAGPVTVVTCDNLRMNGDTLKKGYFLYLNLVNAGELSEWSQENLTFPNSMVDRITPKTEPSLSQEIGEEYGFSDESPIKAEEYIQWVLEDKFITDRPPFEDAGVEIVTDIHDKEESKIRILNGGHCAVAWMAAHKGYNFFYEAIGDPQLELFLDNYIRQETLATLDFVQFDLDEYYETVKNRFKNKNIPDTIQRLASEGASRLPKFVLPVIFERLDRGLPVKYGFEILAAWFAALEKDKKGLLHFQHQDQEAELIDKWFAAADPLAMFLNDQSFWEYKDNKKEQFITGIREALNRLQDTTLK